MSGTDPAPAAAGGHEGGGLEGAGHEGGGKAPASRAGAARRAVRSAARRTARVWSRLPLRAQLTLSFTLLLLVGLALTGGVALTLLHRSLVAQVDQQLTSAAREVVREATTRPDGGWDEEPEGGLPSDYYVVIQGLDGTKVTLARNGVTNAPDLPELTPTLAAERTSGFTVHAAQGDGDWRVLVGVVVNQRTGDVLGTAAVALPLGPAEATERHMGLALVGIALAVVLVGAVSGSWAVRRSLRPLRRMEDTAAAIAAGDLSQRVPDAPASTEVGRLSLALNTMLGQIEHAFGVRAASEERMRRFVADASHELRTPLATIRGYGELYRMGALPPEEHAAAMKRIEDSARRLGGLVEDLLHLARLDEGRPLRHEVVDLAVLAGDAVADLHALAPDRTVRLVPVVPGGTTAGALAHGDEARLRQVVANLVGNVVQHTPAGTPVEIAVGRVVLLDEATGAPAPAALLEVRDHGPGIPPEHAARVFERFYRVDAARGRDSGGAGLGMAIVAAIVEAHGGHVTLGTTPGGGTTVRVRLAAAPDTDPDTTPDATTPAGD